MWSALAAFFAAFINGLFDALRVRRQDHEREEAKVDAKLAEAESETQDVIGEIADERSKLPIGGSANDIAARLRNRTRRNFGNPGAGRSEDGN